MKILPDKQDCFLMLMLLIAHESQKTRVKCIVFEISFLLLLTWERGKRSVEEFEEFF